MAKRYTQRTQNPPPARAYEFKSRLRHPRNRSGNLKIAAPPLGPVINRGTKAAPKWYVKYRDVDGRQKMVRARVTSKAKAREFLRNAEQNVDMGRVGADFQEREADRLKQAEGSPQDWVTVAPGVTASAHYAYIIIVL